MSDKPRRKRDTGAGTLAFFKGQHPTGEQPQTPSSQAVEEPGLQAPSAAQQGRPKTKEPLDTKVKTTINLSAETLALLDALKINARRNKQKATYSDILDEAIRELALKKGIAV